MDSSDSDPYEFDQDKIRKAKTRRVYFGIAFFIVVILLVIIFAATLAGKSNFNNYQNIKTIPYKYKNN